MTRMQFEAEIKKVERQKYEHWAGYLAAKRSDRQAEQYKQYLYYQAAVRTIQRYKGMLKEWKRQDIADTHMFVSGEVA